MLKTIARRLYQVLKSQRIHFYPVSYDAKVFCIGYNKTGTTSLGKALIQLGYRHSTFNSKVWNAYYKQGKIDKVLDYTARFESLDDLPWLKEEMIPILDHHFPKSKFIYLLRDDESWLNSYKKWTYNMTGSYPDLKKGLSSFHNHGKFVRNYFNERPEDILYLDVRDPNGFKILADFLHKKAPYTRIPHENRTSDMLV
jgi:hypothetical protein